MPRPAFSRVLSASSGRNRQSVELDNRLSLEWEDRASGLFRSLRVPLVLVFREGNGGGINSTGRTETIKILYSQVFYQSKVKLGENIFCLTKPFPKETICNGT